MSDELKNAIVGTVFEVELDGINVAAFESCEIPKSTRPVIGNRTGTDQNHQTLTTGNYEPVEITLRKVARSLDSIVIATFREWFEAGGQMKKSGTITYKHPDTGTAYYRIAFENAVCNGLKVPSVNANEPTSKAEFEISFTAPRTYEVAL
ncbi:MAG: phage tail protein [Candidatus Zixiibacteriota bacterium]